MKRCGARAFPPTSAGAPCGPIRRGGRFWRCSNARPRNIRRRVLRNIYHWPRFPLKIIHKQTIGWLRKMKCSEHSDGKYRRPAKMRAMRLRRDLRRAGERLLVDAAVIGGRDRWARRLKGLEREFELRIAAVERDNENQRAGLERQRGEIRELEEFALPVIEQLAALPPSASWGTWLERLGSLARRTLRQPEGVLSAMAELEPMAAVGPVRLDEVSEVLRERLRFLRAEPPPRRYGRVFVGSIEEARGCAFGTVFLPGLAEGLFPQRSFEDPLLLDEFRREVSGLLPTRDDRVEQERLKLRLALGAARERMIASYPRMDTAEGRPRVPSFYALELPRAMDGRLPELKEFEERARAGAPARINWPAPVDAADAIDDAEYDLAVLGRSEKAAHYLLDVNSTLARSLRARWKRWNHKWWDADGLIVAEPGALEALATHRLTARAWSPLSLQKFAECPYQFALHGIFGLRPRDDAEALEQLDPLTRGGLFHAVQFALLGDLKRFFLLPVGPENLAEALRHLDVALDRVAGEYREKLAPAIERVWQTGIEDLRTDLRGWLQFVAANDAGWAPLHFEFAFGLPRRRSAIPRARSLKQFWMRECVCGDRSTWSSARPRRERCALPIIRRANARTRFRRTWAEGNHCSRCCTASPRNGSWVTASRPVVCSMRRSAAPMTWSIFRSTKNRGRSWRGCWRT